MILLVTNSSNVDTFKDQEVPGSNRCFRPVWLMNRIGRLLQWTCRIGRRRRGEESARDEAESRGDEWRRKENEWQNGEEERENDMRKQGNDINYILQSITCSSINTKSPYNFVPVSVVVIRHLVKFQKQDSIPVEEKQFRRNYFYWSICQKLFLQRKLWRI